MSQSPPQSVAQSPAQEKQLISGAETQNNIELLSDIIYNEILPRLPVKSLLLFKCVCKKWGELISSPQFAKTHALQSSLSSRSVIAIDLDSSFEAVDYGCLSDLDYTLFGPNFGETVNYLVSSCNGLVLLISSIKVQCYRYFLDPPDCLIRLQHAFYFVVYNPVLILDTKVYPPNEFVQNIDIGVKDFSFGFGYVSSLKDYSIVAINLRRPEIVSFVCSLRTREWERREIQFTLQNDKDQQLEFEDAWYVHCGTLVKETLNWGITVTFGKDRMKCIATFDLANPIELKHMQLPYANFGESGLGRSAFSLCCMVDCLCAWAYYNDGYVVEMWMMKEYGVQESWNKLFRLQMRFTYSYFFGIVKSVEFMAFDFHRLVFLNSRRDQPEKFHVDFGNYCKAVNYVQTLVSPLQFE